MPASQLAKLIFRFYRPKYGVVSHFEPVVMPAWFEPMFVGQLDSHLRAEVIGT